MYAEEAHYKISWRARSHFPGHHLSQQQGGGLHFRHHVPLINAPDPRRFDVRVSLRDPFEEIWVRLYQQTSSIPVYVVADLSASMGFKGLFSKIETIADFVACISYSAYRTGDRFGFVGCGDPNERPQILPATMNRAAGVELADKLRKQDLNAKSAEGLRQASDIVGSRRALVFLISDFHFPDALLRDVLESLNFHDVVPVVLWDHREYDNLPRFGIARISDPEQNRDRLLLLRPALKQRIQENFINRYNALNNTFREYDRRPLLVQDGFKAEEITHYFFS